MDIAQQVKEAANILDVVGHFVELRKSGSRYIASCPFHDEKTPSFYVTPSKNIYKCFGCDAGGDPINFVMKYRNITFPDAVKEIAGMYNIAPNLFPVSKTLSAGKQETFKRPPPPPSFISKEILRASLKDYGNNNFVQFLISRFGKETAEHLTANYYIGTSKHRHGANVFWQIDKNGYCRTGKVMQYDAATGKRDRSINPTWVHSLLRIEPFVLSQCFFGEHLIPKCASAAVCIVESEKTAIIASAYFPECVWIASSGKDGLNPGKMSALKGRCIRLFPDAGLPDKQTKKTPFDMWTAFAADLVKDGYNVTVSDLYERKATQDERAAGFDLADYLLRWSLSEFQEMTAPAPINTQPQHSHSDTNPQTALTAYPGTWKRFEGQINKPFELLMTADGYPALWDIPGTLEAANTQTVRY